MSYDNFEFENLNSDNPDDFGFVDEPIEPEQKDFRDEDEIRLERIEKLKNKLRKYYDNEKEFEKLFEVVDNTEQSTERVNKLYKALNMEYNNFIDKYFDPDDKMGFNKVIFERQAKLNALRERLKQYYLSDSELDTLFKIIEQAEMEMEKVKSKFNGKNYETTDMMKLQKDLVLIQKKMKTDFEKKLSDIIKAKYEKAKKIKEEMDKKQNNS